MPTQKADSTASVWMWRGWLLLVGLLAIALTYLVLRCNLPIDRAWFLLALLTLMAGLPVARRITEVSAFGVTAKLREEVQRAENAVESLRKLAKLVGSQIIYDVATSHYFFDPNTTADRLNSCDQVMNFLREIGMSDSDIVEVEAPARPFMAFWLHDAIRKVAYPDIASDKSSEFTREFDMARDFRGRKPATPEQLESVLRKYGVWSEQTKGWLESYSRFLKGGPIERRQELTEILSRPKG